MKKKIITMILLVTMVCSMAACGKKEETSQNTEQEDTVTAENNVSEEEQEEEKQAEESDFDLEKWGMIESGSIVNKEGEFVHYTIHMPTPSKSYGYGNCKPYGQNDASTVITVYPDWEEYPVNSLETMLDDCSEWIGEPVLDYYIHYNENYLKNKDNPYDVSFEVKSTELTTINGFSMCKYVGNTIFSNGETTYSHPFVGYAADLQFGEGDYLMWIVQDDSEFSSVSLEETIEEYALKMAESLKLKE